MRAVEFEFKLEPGFELDWYYNDVILILVGQNDIVLLDFYWIFQIHELYQSNTSKTQAWVWAKKILNS